MRIVFALLLFVLPQTFESEKHLLIWNHCYKTLRPCKS